MHPDTRRAWMWVALIPIAFALSIILGEGLATGLGYPDGQGAPLWVAALVGIPVTLLSAVPALAAAVYGRRARRAGHTSGTVALAIGVAVAAYLLITLVLGLAVTAL